MSDNSDRSAKILRGAVIAAGLTIPTLSLIPLGSTADNNHDGFADNSLALLVPSLFLIAVPGVVLAAPACREPKAAPI